MFINRCLTFVFIFFIKWWPRNESLYETVFERYGQESLKIVRVDIDNFAINVNLDNNEARVRGLASSHTFFSLAFRQGCKEVTCRWLQGYN